MLKGLIATSVLLIAMSSPLFASDVAITVTDTSGRSIQGVNVSISSKLSNWSGRTDKNGIFSLFNVPVNERFSMTLDRKDGTNPVSVNNLMFPVQNSTLPITVEYGVVHKADYYSAKLPSNPSTGYSWKVISITPDSIFSLSDTTYTTEETKPENNIRVGAGGIEKVIFKAIGIGKATMVIGYLRIWENGIAPIKYHICSVVSRVQQIKQIQQY